MSGLCHWTALGGSVYSTWQMSVFFRQATLWDVALMTRKTLDEEKEHKLRALTLKRLQALLHVLRNTVAQGLTLESVWESPGDPLRRETLKDSYLDVCDTEVQWGRGICIVNPCPSLTNPSGDTGSRPLGQEDPLEMKMATHFTIRAWEIPWTGSLEGYSLRDRKESDMSTHSHAHRWLGRQWPADHDGRKEFTTQVRGH